MEFLLNNWITLSISGVISLVVTSIVTIFVSFAFMGDQGDWREGWLHYCLEVLVTAVLMGSIGFAFASVPGALGAIAGCLLVPLLLVLFMLLGF